MLGHKRIPSREGGVEVVVEELATRMVDKGNEVTCYNRAGKHVLDASIKNKKIDEYKGVKIKSVLTIDKKGLAAMTASLFGALCTIFKKYDVVHFHAEGPCAMLWLPKLFGRRCIATIHGLDHQRAKWGRFAQWYIMFGEKVAVKFADEIIVLSQGVKDYFKAVYNRETIFIPNGVNKPNCREASIIREKWGLDKETYFLFLGRIVPEKGIQYLIEAFKNVDTDKKLVIAGGGSDTDEFLESIKDASKEDNRVIFTGFVQGEELEELYSNAYVYVLPSDLEGMPLSLLEAMSYGNCCLVSDIEECKSVVTDDNGELKAGIFKKSCVEDLKEQLQKLVDCPKNVKEMKENASQYILKKYNWDDVVEKTLNIYKGR